MAAPQTLSECCISGHLHEGTPEGSTTTIAGLDAYEVWPASHSKAKTILYMSDIFGWELNNARLLADEFARAGFYVIIPDFFKGDPIPEAQLNTIVPREPHKSSADDEASTAAARRDILGPWTVKHLEADPPLFAAALKALRDDPEVGKLGVIGFCWGGRHAVLAGSGANPLADAVVSNHPALLAIPTEIEAISRPVQINTGDVDPFFEAPAREHVKEILTKKTDVPTEFNIISGAVHGYSVRGDMQNPDERARKEKTTTDAINWFTKYLS